MSPRPWAEQPTDRGIDLVARAAARPYWLDRDLRPAPRPRLADEVTADLLVIGGGFTGLWTAVQAAERDPSRSVVLVERDRIAEHASGRNGGFCAASLTHGIPNGISRFGDEMPALLRMGRETLDAIEATLDRLGIDADAERTGELDLAITDWQFEALAETFEAGTAIGAHLDLLDEDAARERVDSPMVRGALYDPDVMMIDPARLAFGLADAAERLGVRIFEGTEVLELTSDGEGVRARTGYGQVRAERGVVATSASRALVRRLRLYTVPVWDYALMTEPLTDDQLSSLGWSGREGLADSGPRFHYFRLTADNRLLWGGWDAPYHFGSDDDPRHERRPEEWALLGEHLLQMFPQLEGIHATHTWGGVIDTCSRFCAFWDSSHRGRVVTSVGFTGLGVGASHFAAATALDLVDGLRTERTELDMVRRKPLPFPPEPIRWLGITLTRREIARSELRGGRRGPWLSLLDRTGLGFDS
ncbi:FAD-dependent oxidoreductase [Gordonia paraffinivorans]|uniref:NAD(P)/FAD-dependent oxidoreductase n=1 Tax=Gordonia paraffinivorans TaxID=175628 RepID=UPI001C92FC2F|nr:FAD-dependent oxidoreductase [Gordonia paraffinivorans]MBY4574194.1 FAD-dependent oxidoreductase [Gordonia paraffinivorans]